MNARRAGHPTRPGFVPTGLERAGMPTPPGYVPTEGLTNLARAGHPTPPGFKPPIQEAVADWPVDLCGPQGRLIGQPRSV